MRVTFKFKKHCVQRGASLWMTDVSTHAAAFRIRTAAKTLASTDEGVDAPVVDADDEDAGDGVGAAVGDRQCGSFKMRIC
jgi:hypothetical protein